MACVFFYILRVDDVETDFLFRWAFVNGTGIEYLMPSIASSMQNKYLLS